MGLVRLVNKSIIWTSKLYK